MAAGAVGGKGANGAKLKGVASTSKQYLKTAVSPKKIAMYTEKLCGVHRKAIIGGARFIAATITSKLGGRLRKPLRELLDY